MSLLKLLAQAAGLRRRYRVTFDSGRREALGFAWRKEADNWARANCAPGDWVTDEVQTLDLRILPDQRRKDHFVDGRRVRWVG